MHANTSLLKRALACVGIKHVNVGEHERGVVWDKGNVKEVSGKCDYWLFDPLGKTAVDVQDRRRPWLAEDDLGILAKSGLLKGEAEVLDLADHQRALMWVDRRFAGIFGPGLHAWWRGMAEVRREVVDIKENGGVFSHPEEAVILSHPEAKQFLEIVTVPPESRAALYRNGQFGGLLPPGRHAYWFGTGENIFTIVDTREQVLDVAGQDMLTADKLGVRMNASLSVRIADVAKYVTAAVDARQSLYREAQLALRAAVGGRELDAILADKTALAGEVAEALRPKAAAYGFDVVSFGVRDVILPGEVKALLLKAVEARKTSEAATILRREETAAMRHQLNAARLLADNPTLMRLRELETVDRLAAGGKLTVLVGEKGADERGLAEKVAGMV